MALIIKKMRPMFTAILTTMDRYEEDSKKGSLIDTKKMKGALKEYQTVVAVGDQSRGINIGDVVCINPKRYAVKKHKEGSLKDGVICDNPVIEYNFNVVPVNGVDHLLLDVSDIEFVVEEYEEVSDAPEDNSSNLILPDKKVIV